jgi:palmitoyltransferase ZDHHC4
MAAAGATLFAVATTVLVLASVAFLFVMLCGPSETLRRGPVGRAYWWLTETLPALGGRVLRRLLGARLYGWLVRATDYTLNQRNPFLQLFYLGLVGGGVVTFVLCAGPYVLDPRYVHPAHVPFIPAAIVATLASFWLACRSSPGRLTPANAAAALQTYPHDGLLFIPKDCPTCKLPRPARSKHCSLCNMCVARFDHRTVLPPLRAPPPPLSPDASSLLSLSVCVCAHTQTVGG